MCRNPQLTDPLARQEPHQRNPDRGNSGGLNAALSTLLNSLQSDRHADRRKYVSDASAQVKGIIVDGKVDELTRFAARAHTVRCRCWMLVKDDVYWRCSARIAAEVA